LEDSEKLGSLRMLQIWYDICPQHASISAATDLTVNMPFCAEWQAMKAGFCKHAKAVEQRVCEELQQLASALPVDCGISMLDKQTVVASHSDELHILQQAGSESKASHLISIQCGDERVIVEAEEGKFYQCRSCSGSQALSCRHVKAVHSWVERCGENCPDILDQVSLHGDHATASRNFTDFAGASPTSKKKICFPIRNHPAVIRRCKPGGGERHSLPV
jgi:hypothetical protein